MVEFVCMTLEQIQAASVEPKDGSTWGGRVDRTKPGATTEEDIRQHQIEEGEDLDAPLLAYQPVVRPRTSQTDINDILGKAVL